jgi:hypothetical protein
MYIWKTQELITDLAEGKMMQWDMTQYLVATTALWYFPGGMCFDPADVEVIDWIIDLAMAAVAGIGIYYCFTVNRRFGNEDFIVRFTVLAWPVTVRWILISIIIYLIMALSFSRYTKLFVFEEWFINLYLIVLEGGYFWVLSNYIKVVARKSVSAAN